MVDRARMLQVKKILIVDDEISLANALALYFRKQGYEAFVAEDMKRGLKIHQTVGVDVILSDYQMPGPSGEDFFRALKELPSEKSATLFFLYSGHYSEGEAKFIKMGMNGVFAKPVSASDIFKVIDAKLSQIK